ncbi:MAG: hypothetical protein HYZ27_00840, partial [Deltaproteobacteria bacterium]|nr:hypothetical protein [Deltaproteobacteria bacterium]
MITSLTLWLLVSAPIVKIAVPPLAPGDGTTPAMLGSLSEAIASELHKRGGYEVLTYQDIQAVLSHEQAKDAVACNEVACYAEMGNALGVAELVTGSLGRVGTSWLLNLKIVDVRAVQVVSAADRRIKGGTLDDVLDVLPALVAELTGPNRKEPAVVAQAAPPSLPAPGPLPVAWADRPLADPALLARLVVLTNGKGHYLAYDAKGDLYGPLFAGSATALYKQRVSGGGRNDSEKSFDQVFWE